MEDIHTACSFFSYLFFLFLTCAALSEANIADFDETWQKRAEIAKANAQAAFVPDPESITNSFNADVQKFDLGFSELMELFIIVNLQYFSFVQWHGR